MRTEHKSSLTFHVLLLLCDSVAIDRIPGLLCARRRASLPIHGPVAPHKTAYDRAADGVREGGAMVTLAPSRRQAISPYTAPSDTAVLVVDCGCLCC